MLRGQREGQATNPGSTEREEGPVEARGEGAISGCGERQLLTWTNQCSVSPKKGQPIEPLGRGRAEARSLLSIQRRVQRCWARLSRRPTHRRAVPAAPSTDRQLRPQGNMACRGPGRSELRGARAGEQAAHSAHQFCPERSCRVGSKTESYNLGQGFRSQSTASVRWRWAHALGNVPSPRPAHSGLFLSGCLRLASAGTSHLAGASTPSFDRSSEGGQRGEQLTRVANLGFNHQGCRPPPHLSLPRSVNSSRPPRTHLYRHWLPPYRLILKHTTWRVHAYLKRSMYAEYWLEAVGCPARQGARSRAWQPQRCRRDRPKYSGGVFGSSQNLSAAARRWANSAQELALELSRARSLWSPHPPASKYPFPSQSSKLRSGISPICSVSLSGNCGLRRQPRLRKRLQR